MRNEEKRKFTRVPFSTRVRVITEYKSVLSEQMRDISLGGAYFYLDETLPENTPCTLKIELSGPASFLSIEVDAEIRRVDEKGMAVQFTKIDLDSLIHLRHLIRIHSMDSQAVDEEFTKDLLDL
ncbi:MAG: PilZ domain-containing protein [Desulfomonile tiedjei]|uniref:PilZ domain-containing protein n=1 Tax=Desulfomonile tiedjei TaxID=2358 RepID=A0A9D6V5I2_9BACT|nr:PilZ domain-containing protein [Desulfomonile tiedjei]